jgi:hypothetical protein
MNDVETHTCVSSSAPPEQCRDATFCVSSLNDWNRTETQQLNNNISNDETQNIASLLPNISND